MNNNRIVSEATKNKVRKTKAYKNIQWYFGHIFEGTDNKIDKLYTDEDLRRDSAIIERMIKDNER